MSRLYRLPAFALLVFALAMVGCDQVGPAPGDAMTSTSAAAASAASGVINGPGRVELNCAYQGYSYTGSEAGGIVFQGGQPASVTKVGSGSSIGIRTGNEIVFFTLAFCDTSGNILATKQVSVKNGGGATCDA